MIQIRHVPEDVHRRLKERAKREGMSLSDYLLQEVTLLSTQLSWEELFEEIDRDGPAIEGEADTAELIRQGREERERARSQDHARLPARMIILDASAVVDLLIKPAADTEVLRARIRASSTVYAPHLMDAEVTNTLRRHLLQGRIDQVSARRALRRLTAMRVSWWPHRALLGRALALRDQLTAYDAINVAMAEVTGATLLTRDGRRARAAGHRARVALV